MPEKPPQTPENPPPRGGQAQQGPEHHWPWLLLAVFAFYFLWTQLNIQQPQDVPYTEFLQQLEDGRVATVQLRGQQLFGRYRGEPSPQEGGARFDFRTVIPAVEDRKLLDDLRGQGVEVRVVAEETSVWLQILVGFLPWLLIFGLFWYSARMMRGRMGSGLDFGKSRARRYERSEDGPGYDAVAGLEYPKRDLQEIIDYLKDPKRFQEIGAKMPRGILMMGPPGTGKTLLARATAAEAGVPFFSISASEFIEMFVGVGASRVREMFDQAKKEAPALIFIDEIDSVGRTRGTGLGGGHDEREQTLNQILSEMDGFEDRVPVVVLAATNRPDVLDPALLRPGRFDRKIVLELPQRPARHEILRVHVRKVPLAQDVELEEIAAATVGFSGADLANLVNEAALLAARENRHSVTQEDFHQARDKVMMGERRDDLLNDEERERVACHEAGHALMALHQEHSDPLEKVSIIPRGRALGVTEQLPEKDRLNVDEVYLRERLRIMLGGRCAERQVFGNYSSGAADDLKQATQLARRMVSQWGMSEAVGPVSFPTAEEHPFLGRELAQPRDFSESTAELLDREVMALLKDAEREVLAVMESRRGELDTLRGALLERETLTRTDIEELLRPTAN